jgi:hypothetical protein
MPAHLPIKRIFKTWWPLAGSWLMMSLEGPMISAIIARLANPEINLAAYGGIILPTALIIEAPIVMLLAASTALSKDWASYLKLRRFMLAAGATLTVMHALIVFTPLYYFVVNRLIDVPPELVQPGRIGLAIMLPWTWSIGFRRFNQGVMIRFGHSDGVMMCTVVRLSTLATLLLSGYFIGSISGIIVATVAQAMGVTFEGLYSGIRVRPILTNELRNAPAVELITWRAFAAFYIPLVFTSLLQFIGQPIVSAALSRMPQALESLAAWSVLSSFVFLTRSVGVAYNEVVVALLDPLGSSFSLRRFAYILAGSLLSISLLLAVTPLSLLWFEKVTALAEPLSLLARKAFWLLILLPPISVFQSWFQGSIMYGRKTRPITESVVIFLLTLSICEIAGVVWGGVTGLYVGAFGFAIANLTQASWLGLRSFSIRRHVHQRDREYLAATLAEQPAD